MTPDCGADAPLTLADVMSAGPHRRFPWRVVVIVTVAVGLVVAAGVLAYATRPDPMHARTIGPSRADAARECKTAVEAEAQRRSDAARATRSGSVTSTLSGVDVAEPVWRSPAWMVDATLRFTIVSIFGQTPVTAFVRCTAIQSGGRVSTSIAAR